MTRNSVEIDECQYAAVRVLPEGCTEGLATPLAFRFAEENAPVEMTEGETLLFHNWAVAIADQFGAHGFGVFDIGEWSDLYVKQLVSRCGGRDERGIFFLLQRVDQGVSVFLLADSSDLNIIASRWDGRRRIDRTGS